VAELIVAFDVASGRDALALAGRLPALRWAKIGPVLYNSEGAPLIKEFTQRGIRVFLDLKWHDIPNIVARAVTAARELGVSMTTVHCLGGRNMLAAAAEAAGSPAEIAVIGVTVLTSHDAAELEGILGRGVPDIGFEAERLARSALQAGLRGVVTSGHEVGIVREALGSDPWIVVPGIRAPGESAGDQVRTVEPAEAVRRGATHLVVGRPITAARDPVAAYQRLVEALD
jgi:orotidine-5'-phosphate decarboxylase